MGRRKIEIKAIKDDRNRSVTFLKRKGGLFKKAHELSVLCSVEVAVIIFGTNKKLYEYSSGDIHDTIQKYGYYSGPHEHKGPADYAGKAGGDDDDDEDGDEGGAEEPGPVQQQQQQQVPPQMQGQPVYPPHMRPGPSASPPVGNSTMPYHPRQRTPQPPMPMGSRPASRTDVIRRGTPHMQPQHTPPLHTPPMHHGPSHPQNGYPNMPSQVYAMAGNQAMYQQGAAPQHPQTAGFAPTGFTQFTPPHPQMQQMYAQEQQRRASVGPVFREPPRPQSHPQVQVEAPPHTMSPPQIQQEPPLQQEQMNDGGLQPHQPRPLKKQHSIFTPIDNSRSMLAASWGLGPSPVDKLETPVKSEAEDRSKSIDVGSIKRSRTTGDMSVTSQPPHPTKAHTFQQPQRTQSTASMSGDASKRPRLKVHIPNEPSEDGVSAGSASGSAQRGGQQQETSTNSTPSRKHDQSSGGSGIVLPAPSPGGASQILSAGASGPPNPFARPLPPSGGPGNAASQANAAAYSSNQNSNSGFDTQTPISALPSRFAGQLLPSPSQFFADWNFGARNGDESAVLPSPLNFQTPLAMSGPGFGNLGGVVGKDDGDEARKRKADEGESGGEKRMKT